MGVRGIVPLRSRAFRVFPKLSVSFRFVPFRSVAFRSVPPGSAPVRGGQVFTESSMTTATGPKISIGSQAATTGWKAIPRVM